MIYLGQAAGTIAGGNVLGHQQDASGYVALASVSLPLFLVAMTLSVLASRRSIAPAAGARPVKVESSS